MESTLPNLELLEYQAKQILHININKRLTCIVFEQSWSSTATAFSGWGGCAITPAYTTIFMTDEVAAVFIANKHCYSLEITPTFLQDLSRRELVSQQSAITRYKLIRYDRQSY